ncbi:MAG: glycoside hydrolase family 15 protein [Anaerolineaceae bacterium]
MEPTELEALKNRSIQIILQNQHTSGAYLASPNFATYHYCWFRDGSYIAHGMQQVQAYSSAEKFHDWAAITILSQREVIQSARRKIAQGDKLGPADFLHTRYTLDGKIAEKEDWPNFQSDGFGTWLWALSNYVSSQGMRCKPIWLEAAELVCQYLSSVWQVPCYDLWEEFPEQQHTYTLAAIYGGLRSIEGLVGLSFKNVAEEILQVILTCCQEDGVFVKAVGRKDVDASLVALAYPYQVVEPGSDLMRNTVKRIESDLVQNYGAHRYAADTYYGGGQWLLLSAWLGCYHANLGEVEEANAYLNWIINQSDHTGHMPEQVPLYLNQPAYYPQWLERWGEIANPLLWSHASFLCLTSHLKY